MEIQTRVQPSKPAAQVCATDAARGIFDPLVILTLSQLQNLSHSLPVPQKVGETIKVRLDSFTIRPITLVKQKKNRTAVLEKIESGIFTAALFDSLEDGPHLLWVCKTITPAI